MMPNYMLHCLQQLNSIASILAACILESIPVECMQADQEVSVEEKEYSREDIMQAAVMDDIFAAVAAIDVNRVTHLLAELPGRATQVRPTDGYTPLHVAADARTLDAATDGRLATIMLILLNPCADATADAQAMDFQDRTPAELLHMQAPDDLTNARSQVLDWAVWQP
jgi:hypothetical protein